MSFNQFLHILKSRWLLAVSVFLVTVLMTWGVSSWLPSRYTSTATVLVETKADPVSGQPSATSGAYMATQVEIIESPHVAQRVARKLRLDVNPQFQQNWEQSTGRKGDYNDWLAKWLKNGLEVKPAREASVIEVSYTFTDPAFATAVANAFVQAYVDTVLELRVEPAKQYSGFFDDRLKAARDRLEAAQSRLTAFQKANSIVATDERIDVETARMDQLSSQLVGLRAATADSTSRAAQARQRADVSQDVMSNPVISGLKSEIVRLEAGLQQLTSRLGDNHPQVAEMKVNLAALKSKLEDEIRRTATSVAASNSINQAREAEIKAEFDAQRARVLKVKALRDEMLVLQQDVANAQRTYDGLQGRLSQTNLESQNTQTNVAVLNPATEPYERSSPKVFLNTVVAAVGGVILAIGCVLLMEMADRRLRSAEDIVQAFDLPVIGYMPRSGKGQLSLAGARTTKWLGQRTLRLPGPELKQG